MFAKMLDEIVYIMEDGNGMGGIDDSEIFLILPNDLLNTNDLSLTRKTKQRWRRM
jgi:hypothetical protein